jgi:N-acetyl-1-D-myo-inositol-2-amino-2-deoxy-alpha-D-glucopyranoside deacetylase
MDNIAHIDLGSVIRRGRVGLCSRAGSIDCGLDSARRSLPYDSRGRSCERRVSMTSIPGPYPFRNGLLLIFAHPDDEAFGGAGTMAAATAHGHPVTLICATRGELGESGALQIANPDLLGAIREQELRQACGAVGVVDVRFLGYRDSGMAGSPTNDDPRALMQIPLDRLAMELAVQIRALQPRIVITFGPEGIYGHPDHLKMHAAADRAIDLAADPDWTPAAGDPWRIAALYYSTPPREDFVEMLDTPDSPLPDADHRDRATFGTPRAEITDWFDVSPWFAAKQAAMRAHRSQTGDGAPLAMLTDPRMERFYRQETFVQAPLPWPAAGDLLAEWVAGR